MVNFPLGIATEEPQKRDLKTPSRNPCQHATFTLSCGQPLPLTEGLGGTLYTSQPPALRTFEKLPSRRSEVRERPVSPQSQPRQHPSPAAAVAEFACPA